MAKRRTELPHKLPVEPLPDLLRWWKAERVPGAIIGGLAVSLLSNPRTTEDIDAVIRIEDVEIEKFIRRGTKFGFQPRIPSPAALAADSRVILMRHRPSGIGLDLSIAGSPFEQLAIENAQHVRVGRRTVPVMSPEDLIILKVVAGRSIDKTDVVHLLEFFPNLDLDRVRTTIAQFSEFYDERDLVDEFRRLLPRERRGDE
jgi:hypothetical protein